MLFCGEIRGSIGVMALMDEQPVPGSRPTDEPNEAAATSFSRCHNNSQWMHTRLSTRDPSMVFTITRLQAIRYRLCIPPAEANYAPQVHLQLL